MSYSRLALPARLSRVRERDINLTFGINVMFLAQAVLPFLNQEVNRITCEGDG